MPTFSNTADTFLRIQVSICSMCCAGWRACHGHRWMTWRNRKYGLYGVTVEHMDQLTAAAALKVNTDYEGLWLGIRQRP